MRLALRGIWVLKSNRIGGFWMSFNGENEVPFAEHGMNKNRSQTWSCNTNDSLRSSQPGALPLLGYIYWRYSDFCLLALV
jgi:hypothetical protein